MIKQHLKVFEMRVQCNIRKLQSIRVCSCFHILNLWIYYLEMYFIWKALLSMFFAYPAETRKLIYTTNIIEGLNRQFRKITKTSRHLSMMTVCINIVSCVKKTSPYIVAYLVETGIWT